MFKVGARWDMCRGVGCHMRRWQVPLFLCHVSAVHMLLLLLSVVCCVEGLLTATSTGPAPPAGFFVCPWSCAWHRWRILVVVPGKWTEAEGGTRRGGEEGGAGLQCQFVCGAGSRPGLPAGMLTSATTLEDGPDDDRYWGWSCFCCCLYRVPGPWSQWSPYKQQATAAPSSGVSSGAVTVLWPWPHCMARSLAAGSSAGRAKVCRSAGRVDHIGAAVAVGVDDVDITQHVRPAPVDVTSHTG
jgi:hypothetical protein